MGRVSDARERLLTAIIELMWENSYSSATVEAICGRAQVKKGSFYYFFESKSDLALAALSDRWQKKQQILERLFNSKIPGVQRLLAYFQWVYQQERQCLIQRKCTLGCLFSTVATEVRTQDEAILQRTREVLDALYLYFEQAVRDAVAQGEVNISCAEATARCIFCLYEGVLTQVRVYNQLEQLNSLAAGTLQLLGIGKEFKGSAVFDGLSLGNGPKIDAAA